MDSLDSIFGKNKKYKVLNSIKSTAFINKKIKMHWSEIVGDLEKDIKFCYVKDKTLMIASKNPAWVTEIEFFRPEILHRIAKHVGKGKVKDIKFLPYSEERAQGKRYKKNTNLSLEELIVRENKRKRNLKYIECSGCKTLWPPIQKECLFCSTSL